jgi:hypothetical protein
MWSKLAAIFSIPLLAAAIPSGIQLRNDFGLLGNYMACPIVGDAVLKYLENTTFSVPQGQAVNHITFATGVQNYTCNDTGTYVPAGAVAKLYDISCLFGTDAFETIQDEWHELPYALKESIQEQLDRTPLYVSDHYFITNPITGNGTSPKFASARDGGKTFMVAEKTAGKPAPNPADIDWLQLSAIQGGFAKTCFRMSTRAGKPPASCESGSGALSVPYVTKCWFLE